MFPIRDARPGPSPAPRRLAATLAVAALLAAFALPAPAAAQPGSALFEARPLAAVFQWLDGLLDGFGPAPAEPDGPKAAVLPEGCSIDPNGAPCADGSTLPPPPDLSERSGPERPRTP